MAAQQPNVDTVFVIDSIGGQILNSSAVALQRSRCCLSGPLGLPSIDDAGNELDVVNGSRMSKLSILTRCYARGGSNKQGKIVALCRERIGFVPSSVRRTDPETSPSPSASTGYAISVEPDRECGVRLSESQQTTPVVAEGGYAHPKASSCQTSTPSTIPSWLFLSFVFFGLSTMTMSSTPVAYSRLDPPGECNDGKRSEEGVVAMEKNNEVMDEICRIVVAEHVCISQPANVPVFMLSQITEDGFSEVGDDLLDGNQRLCLGRDPSEG